jgi:WS/DGAT/MGAT family acyltransferase
MRQLKRLAGRIMSQHLDRGKPLWEMWFVDGLEHDKIAVITKAHHAMVDGVSGVDLLASLMAFDPQAQPGTPTRWMPRPAPTGAQLFIDELQRRATLPVAVARAGREVVARPGRAVSVVADAIEGIGQAIAAGLRPASPTPLNPDIGPHRRFDWTRVDLDAAKQVKNRLGGTINDVVLATVAGALRRFLKGRGLEVESLDLRSMVPVNVRTETQRGALGNRVSFLVAQLPVDERTPRARMERVIETTQQLKHSKQVFGAEVLEEISDRTFPSLFVQFARLAATARSYNLVVTNVPGPPAPVYMLGGRMEAIYPLVPLFMNQALGIALFSYSGGLYWGFNADWDALPDLHDLVEAVDVEFKALSDAAAAVPVAVTKADAKAGRGDQRKRTGAKRRAA